MKWSYDNDELMYVSDCGRFVIQKIPFVGHYGVCRSALGFIVNDLERAESKTTFISLRSAKRIASEMRKRNP